MGRRVLMVLPALKASQAQLCTCYKTHSIQNPLYPE
jgi:hypothetical protein